MGEEYSRRLKTNTATERNEEKKQVRKNGKKNEERKKKKTETEVVNKGDGRKRTTGKVKRSPRQAASFPALHHSQP